MEVALRRGMRVSAATGTVQGFGSTSVARKVGSRFSCRHEEDGSGLATVVSPRPLNQGGHVKLLKTNAGEVAEWLKAAVC